MQQSRLADFTFEVTWVLKFAGAVVLDFGWSDLGLDFAGAVILGSTGAVDKIRRSFAYSCRYKGKHDEGTLEVQNHICTPLGIRAALAF